MMASCSLRASLPVVNQASRLLSTEVAPNVAAPKPRGAGLFQRLTSFVVGAGMTALGTQYLIYEELKEGNKLMLAKQKELEKRLDKLEKKK